MVASLLTCPGASVGVSISTQRRIPSRMVLASKRLEVFSMLLPVIVIPGCAIFGADPNLEIPGSRSGAPRNDDLFLALVRPFARGDLLDHLDNAAPELGIGNARERPR